MNDETRELNLADLDGVSGGGLVDGIIVGVIGNAVYDFMKDHHGVQDSLNYIKQQAGKA